MVAIIDYDAGNIRSVEKAVRYLGKEVTVTSEPEEILAADRVILPGVGAFGDAMKRLHAMGLVEVIRQAADRGTPFLGICLGLQLLFEKSEESPGVPGLGLLRGEILRLPEALLLWKTASIHTAVRRQSPPPIEAASSTCPLHPLHPCRQ